MNYQTLLLPKCQQLCELVSSRVHIQLVANKSLGIAWRSNSCLNYIPEGEVN